MKWYCHDPVAIAIYDIPRCDSWTTAGCCYGGDNGASCDTDLLQEDANIIYDQWVSAGHACDSNWGEMVEDCPSETTTTTTTSTTTTTTTPTPTQHPTEGWIYREDFSDLSTLAANWDIEVVPEPHNNEMQYYTDRTDNIKVEDGKLIITPKRENYEHRQYTSGRTTSNFNWRYGRVEVVAKTPKGRGLWPAIWMMPENNVYNTWPGSGEIDIFEGKGQSPNEMQSTIHYGSFPCCDGHRHAGSPIITADCDHTTGFHTYSLDWTPNELVYKFDGQAIWKTNLNVERHSYYGSRWTAPFDEHFHLVLNVAVGGWFLDGPDENDVWSYPDARMEIDSVTVWPLEYIIDESKTQCSQSDECDNCQPDTDDCSGSNSYMQYHLKDGTYEGSCNANMDNSVTHMCGSMKWFCHDTGAQERY